MPTPEELARQKSIFAVPLPRLTEQTRFMGEVEQRLSVVDELEAAVPVNVRRRTRLRQSILQPAFSSALMKDAA